MSFRTNGSTRRAMNLGHQLPTRHDLALDDPTDRRPSRAHLLREVRHRHPVQF